MNKPTFTFGKIIGGSSRPDPKYLKSEEVDAKFDKLEGDENGLNTIRKNVKSLVAKNNITPESLDNILILKDLCDYKKYRELLKRRDDFLIKHQIMDADQFSQLFGNDELKSKKKSNNSLISGKYNKANINQGILGLCAFDTFLRQLKETPLFETLIRCSLQRNENNDGWKCLIPLCNNEGKYEEILDEDVNFLKTTEYNGNKLISDSSLGFNILESLIIKMSCNRKKYPKLTSGFPKFCSIEYKSFVCDDLKTMSTEDLHDITYGVDISYLYDYSLGKNTTKIISTIRNYNDEEVEWLLNLMKTGIIKINLGVKSNIRDVYRKYISKINDESVISDEIDGETNEKILNKRGYNLTILHNAGPHEELSLGVANTLGDTFKINGTNEWFVHGHAYSIEGMHTKNGEKMVTIINPRYTGKKIEIPLKYLKDFFYIRIYGFNIDSLFSGVDANQ